MLMFRYVIPALMFVLQYFLYRKTLSWLRRDYPGNVRARRVTVILFAAFNCILIVLSIVRPKLLDLPQWLVSSVSYPFVIWFCATLFIGLVKLVLR